MSKNNSHIILETERLILRTWTPEDVGPMAEISQDPQVMRYFPALQNLKQTQQLIEKVMAHYREHGFTLYALELKSDGTFIGFTGLLTPDFEAHFTPAVEIGWRLASAYWGRGYATEAARCVLHHAFMDIGLEEVVSFSAVANAQSRRVMEKIGLHHNPKDDFDNPKLAADSPLRRHVLYRLTRAEYLQRLKGT